ncbi:tRNA pseudouridine(55) synthase TruB [Puteibacter caeruleilacunae]|nr:tRNA pseudouridine(55) synthase TruB [Puteibacter caeruleilacunae]
MESVENVDFQKGEILLIDKPLDWTSFDVVKRVRGVIWRKFKYKYKKLKVGHAGTLDPKASGLMVLCTGKATKRIEEFQAGEKEYIATLKFGATTPSYDSEMEEDAQFDIDHITKESLLATCEKFLGDIEQTPPVFSAVKINGVRAFDYARKGEEVKLRSRIVNIREIELLSFEMPKVELRIVCSKGTYIRSLAYDIGKAINSGAYLTGLRRTRIGEMKVEDAMNLEDFTKIIDAM